MGVIFFLPFCVVSSCLSELVPALFFWGGCWGAVFGSSPFGVSALSHPRTALVEEGSCVVGPLLLPLLPAVLRRGGATGVVVGCGAGDGDGALATRG